MTAEKFTVQEIHDIGAELFDSRTKAFLDIASHEDPEGKLKEFLLAEFSFDGKSVLEAGAGAGRVTDYYADRVGSVVLTDASHSMVNILKKKYSRRNNVTAELCEHKDLKKRFPETFDLFLSAFSFGYDADPGSGNYDAFLEKILPAARQHIIIECCGIYDKYDILDQETVLYVEALERRFHKKEILTEFVFSSPAKANEAAGFLFQAVADRVKRENRTVLPDKISVFYD